MRRHALFLTLAAGMLAACANASDAGAGAEPAADPASPAGGDLRIGQTWHLVDTADGSLPAGLTLTFAEDTVDGTGPVNDWSAVYRATADGDLVLSDRLATAAGSGDRTRTGAESTYFSLLDGVDGYTAAAAGELYLFDGDATTLVYSLDPSVEEDPTAVPDESEALAERVVGMDEEAARAAVESAGHDFRVVARDGEEYLVTLDYLPTRVNVTVEDGRVTEATLG